MARFFSVKISGTGPGGAVAIYLTQDGNAPSGNRLAQVEIPEADILLTPNSGNTTVGNTGAPFTEKPLVPGKGRAFQIRLLKAFPTAVYDDLRELIDYVDDQTTELRLEASGEPGDIDVQFIPNHAPTPIGFTGFSIDAIRGLTIRGITSAVNP